MTHLTDEEIELLLASRLDSDRQQGAIRHLLAGCGLCSRKLVERAPNRLLDEATGSSFGRIAQNPRSRAIASALRRDLCWRTDDKKLVRSLELLRAANESYDILTRDKVRGLQGIPLVNALLQRAWDLRSSDPDKMRWIIYNALTAAEHLRSEDHPKLTILDLQARAWGELSNAYRVRAEFSEAEGALSRARTLMRQGSGDLQCLARLAEIEGSLRNTQGRRAEARELFDRTYRLYRNLNIPHLAGRALIAKGNTGTDNETSLETVNMIRQGLSLIDHRIDPGLATIGNFNLIATLSTCGEYRMAGELLLKSDLRRLLREDAMILLKLRWTEGMILQGLGKFVSAEKILLDVRQQYMERENRLEAALVALGLLPLWIQRGNSRDIRATAREAYTTFRELRILPEAARAKYYLQ